MMANASSPECVEDLESSTPDAQVLRCDLPDAAAAEEWIKRYSQETNTGWIVHKSKTNCSRMVFRKVFHCQLSGRNKTSSKRNNRCPATLDIKIKKVNEATKKNDKFLRRQVPLAAVIRLVGKHNHSTESAEALKMLRPSPETRETFHAYFESGMTPARAMAEHEKLLSMQENGPVLLANGTVNPGSRTVYHWHERWRTTKFGPLDDPVPTLQEKASHYAVEGTRVSTDSASDGCWAAFLVTPIMPHALSLDSSSDIISIDSTSSCDNEKTTATMLLAATKDTEKDLCNLEAQLRRIHSLGEGSDTYAALVKAVANGLSAVKTSSAAHHLMLGFKALVNANRRRGRKITLQPTSLARHRPGVRRGAAWIPSGRPANATASRKGKRSHKLSQTIWDNVAGARLH